MISLLLFQKSKHFGHDVDKRTYNIVKDSYDKPIEKREELEPVTVSLKDNSIFAYAPRKFAWTERLQTSVKL